MIENCSNNIRKTGNINTSTFPVPASFLSIILLWLLIAFSLLTSRPVSAIPADQKILIIYHQTQGFSHQLIEHLQNNMSLSGYQTSSLMIHRRIRQRDLQTINQQQLLIAIGSETTRTLLEANVSPSILSTLIPRYISNSLQASYPEKKNWSSLLINQPIDRQFHLITAILGQRKDTAVLLGPYTKDLNKTLNQASAKTSHKLSIEEIKYSEQLSSSLSALNQSVDVLLTLPDPIVYNKSTIRGILLSAYRNKLPIIGFSKSYVKAGAIAAIYSKPEQISEQVTRLIKQYFSSGSFKDKKVYPDAFSVALNKKIARSLGINLATEEAIIHQIKRAENKQ